MKVGFAMKVAASSMKKMQALAAMKSMKAKKLGASTSFATVSDSLWHNDPALAASLAIVPLDSAKRSKISTSVSSQQDEPDVKITRALPPALQRLKDADEWGKDAQVAIQNYLKSLGKKGFACDDMINAYNNAKGEAKKQMAKRLCLCKDAADLKAFEVEYVGNSTEDSEESGWISAFQVWDKEKLLSGHYY